MPRCSAENHIMEQDNGHFHPNQIYRIQLSTLNFGRIFYIANLK